MFSKIFSLSLVALLLFVSIVPVNVSATLSEDYPSHDIRSSTDNHGKPIQESIAEATSVYPEYISKYVELLFADKVDSYRWDTSQYISQYPMNLETLVQIANGKPINEALENAHPNIIAPVFGTIDNTETVAGYVYFNYTDNTPNYEQLVVLNGTWLNGTVESIFDILDVFHNFEGINDYFDGQVIKSATFLQFEFSQYRVGNCILLVETDLGIQVLDITNAAHNPSIGDSTKVYSLAEFISYRSAYEAERDAPTDEFIFGGDGDYSDNTSSSSVTIKGRIILVFLAITVVLLLASRLFFKKKQRSRE